jgi:hypothetical protein
VGHVSSSRGLSVKLLHRVLKKREARLKREQDGLKRLISGLVGGAALLKEWEREWKENFGGDEKDEVEGEDDAEARSGDENEDGDEDGEAEDEDEGPMPKRPRASKDKKGDFVDDMGASPSQVNPEKRKRGRPKKAQKNPPELSEGALASPLPNGQGQGQVQQYLLATFAFFSFFNSQFTSTPRSSYPHTHAGSVLTHTHNESVPMSHTGYGWRDAVQAFHLVVSALVFLSIVLPWLPTSSKRKVLRLFVPPLLSRAADGPSAKSDDAVAIVGPESLADEAGARGWVGARLGLVLGRMDQTGRLRLGKSVALNGISPLFSLFAEYEFG